MNHLFITILLSVLGPVYATDSGSRDIVIPVNFTFSSIRIYSDIIVYIKQGEKNEIIAKDQKAANDIRFRVDQDVLVIHGREGFFSNKSRGRIIIKVKDIHAITVMDDAEVRTVGQLSENNLKLEIFGDGAIYANTCANEVTTFIKGLGKIEVIGNFKNTSVNKDAYGNMITIYR